MVFINMLSMSNVFTDSLHSFLSLITQCIVPVTSQSAAESSEANWSAVEHGRNIDSPHGPEAHRDRNARTQFVQHWTGISNGNRQMIIIIVSTSTCFRILTGWTVS
jgi:hypothetical protein